MTNASIEKRIAHLELQLAKLQSELSSSSAKSDKDWRRTIGMFTDDPGMKSVFDEARKLREADRRKSRVAGSKRRKPTR